MITNKDAFYFNQLDPTTLSEKEWNKDITKHYRKVKELLEEVTNKTEVISNESFDALLNDNYAFTLEVKNDNPYFHKDCYLVALYFNYCSSKPVTVYINKEYLNKLTGNKPEVTKQDEEVINEIETTIQSEVITAAENNDTTYTVKHTTFTEYTDAVQYCKDNDFDPNSMLITNQTKIEPIYWYEYRLRGFSIGCQPKGFIEHNDNIGRHGIVAYNRILSDKELSDYDLQLYSAEFKTA